MMVLSYWILWFFLPWSWILYHRLCLSHKPTWRDSLGVFFFWMRWVFLVFLPYFGPGITKEKLSQPWAWLALLGDHVVIMQDIVSVWRCAPFLDNLKVRNMSDQLSCWLEVDAVTQYFPMFVKNIFSMHCKYVSIVHECCVATFFFQWYILVNWSFW